MEDGRWITEGWRPETRNNRVERGIMNKGTKHSGLSLMYDGIKKYRDRIEEGADTDKFDK